MEDRVTFSSLATELRIEIWKYTIRQPQIVEIYCNNYSGYAQSPVPPPVILYVCRESRYVAERHFSLLTGYCWHFSIAPIYILLHLDTVYFSLRETLGFKRDYRYLGNLFRQIDMDMAQNLRTITIDLGGCLDAEQGRIGLQRFLPLDAFLRFRNLRRMDVVAGKRTGLKDMGDSLELVRLHQSEEESSDSDSDSEDEDFYCASVAGGSIICSSILGPKAFCNSI